MALDYHNHQVITWAQRYFDSHLGQKLLEVIDANIAIKLAIDKRLSDFRRFCLLFITGGSIFIRVRNGQCGLGLISNRHAGESL